jgi:hypothetical protein
MALWACLLILVWICPGVAAANGEKKGKMNPELFLPSETAGWRWDNQEERHDSRTLFGYMDGAAELYLSYGFQDLTVRRYVKPGLPPITVELYKMASSADAYGVFTFERQDDPAGIGQGSEFGGGMLRFWKGTYFASVYAEGEGAEVESALTRIGKGVADAIPTTGPEPELIGSVPGSELGLVDGSVRFLRSHVLLNQRFFIAHRNILNLDGTAEAVLAEYRRDKQKVHLLIVRYPDPKVAGDAYQSFLKACLPDAGGRDRAKTDDKRWTLVRRQGKFVLIVFGAPTETDAEGLITAVERKLPGRRRVNTPLGHSQNGRPDPVPKGD